MNKYCISFLAILTISILSCHTFLSQPLDTKNLRVESLDDPMGIDAKYPHFSWQLSAENDGTNQTAYRLQVFSSADNLAEGDAAVWDSHKIQSNKSRYINYQGPSLKSGEEYFWRVKVWNNHDNESEWSEPAKWSMGLLSSEDWRADWITYDTTRASAQPLFQKDFSVNGKIKRAIAYISGLGYYQLNLNGEKVGDHVLDPGRTNYHDYAFYVTYDVADYLQQGDNALGVMLGDGWYNQDKVWGGQMAYGVPRLICQLEVEFEDGTRKIIVSDNSWEWTDGPVIKSNVYKGEVYDARKEIEGWSTTSPEQSDWMAAKLAKNNPSELKAQMIPPIKKMKNLEPESFFKVGDQKYIFDFGQNFAGWVQLKTDAPEGTRIVMRSAEQIFPDSTLNPASTGVYATNVVQTEEYISEGNGWQVWEPRFTYHGFRYVEVSGLTEVNKNLLTGIVVHTSVDKTGTFETSNAQINRLHKMANWTLISNLHSVPTDCPHREKAGWLGDTHAIAEMSNYNYDMEAFWLKYLNDIRSTAEKEVKTIFFETWDNLDQRVKPSGIPFMVSPGKRSIGAASPDWGTALVQLPWYLYVYYGNKKVLQDFYPDMKQWVSYVKGLSPGFNVKNGLGDWCPPGRITPKATAMPLTSTAFHYLDVKIMEQVAEILEYEDDEEFYRGLRQDIKEKFIDQFYDSEKKTFGSQTANAMALDFGLVPEGNQKAVSDHIVNLSREKLDGFLNTGIFGLPRIFGALSNYGNASAAHDILTKKGYNSFEYMWKNYDATTLWEILPVNDFYDNNKGGKNERSHNHPMQGGYDAWFYKGILGINPDPNAPGFKNIIFRPVFFKQLDWAKGSFDSPYGNVKSDWSWEEDQLRWELTVPPSTGGEIQLPYAFANTIMLNNSKVRGEKISGPSGVVHYRYKLEAGDHTIKISP